MNGIASTLFHKILEIGGGNILPSQAVRAVADLTGLSQDTILSMVTTSTLAEIHARRKLSHG